VPTPASTFVYRHTRIGILTEHAADLVDLTDGLDALLADAEVTAGILDVLSCQAGTGILVTAHPDEARASSSVDPVARLSIAEGRLQLDAATRVFLGERAGPGARHVAVVMAGETRR